nr:DUF368 domain-containing protein [uncultured Oscillibacter sp.]
MILKLFQGFCMALADSVPGVSGGTVAFILGFYERFIGALQLVRQGKGGAETGVFLSAEDRNRLGDRSSRLHPGPGPPV